MIFLQEDHHAIGQFYAAWLLRIKRREWRNYDLAPVRNLALSGGQKGAQTQSQYRNGSEAFGVTPILKTPNDPYGSEKGQVGDPDLSAIHAS